MTGSGATLLQELFAELAREARERSPKKGSRERRRERREEDDKQIKEVAGERHENNPRARATLLHSRRWAFIDELLDVSALGGEHTCSHDAPHFNALPVQMLGQVWRDSVLPR